MCKETGEKDGIIGKARRHHDLVGEEKVELCPDDKDPGSESKADGVGAMERHGHHTAGSSR